MQSNETPIRDIRFIEETFPVKEVSLEADEKGIRRGNISALHIWWARRPLTASRATAFGALIPFPKTATEVRLTKKFVIEIAKRSSSLNSNVLAKARQEILQTFSGIPPKVLDPFGGGAAIPLECLRLGCDTYSNDYNPVAVLLQKCVLEYPEKYGSVKTHASPDSPKSFLYEDSEKRNPLYLDVKKWGQEILEETKKEIGKFYPSSLDGSIPVAFLWARTIPCQNPSCGAIIPLLKQFWLANTDSKKIALFPFKSGKQPKFKIVGTGYETMPSGYDPGKGNVSRAIATCIVCGSVVDDKTTRMLFCSGKADQMMLAVASYRKSAVGKIYRVSSENDLKVYEKAKEYGDKKRAEMLLKHGIDPIPDEPTPEGKGKGAERAFSLRNYKMDLWGDLFNSRQKLLLMTLVEKTKSAYERMLQESYDAEYATAVITYLALLIDKIASSSNMLSRWQPKGEKIADVFARQAMPMVWDYPEVNALTGASRSYDELFSDILRIIVEQSSIAKPAVVTQASATNIPYPDNFFDAVFTDPPYYDNVPYSYLSDFFYVWLKRSIGHLYPELFSTPLSPKTLEIVAYSIKGDFDRGKQFFEEMLKKSFIEINRVLKSNGIAIIVFAHKSTAGWETLLNSLLDSGLVITAAWPINTEMKSRLRAKESAALASSIYMIARKMRREDTGFFREVKEELRKHLESRLDRLWADQVAGADFFIAAIGTSIEVFGKYNNIIDDEGNQIRADRFLELVRTTVTDYAVHKILRNGFAAEISQLTRFYLLWRWAYGEAKVPFDDARKLAQSVGIDLSNEWNRKGSFIQKDAEFVKVLGPEERKENNDDQIVGGEDMIDTLHKSLLLWKAGKKEKMLKLLKESRFTRNDVFFKVAQAISEALPETSKEKKLLEGFTVGKGRLLEEVRKDSGQKRLFEG